MTELAKVSDVVQISSKRQHVKVPWSEIEPLVNELPKVNLSHREAMLLCGYSESMVAEWKRHGQAPARAKYVLMGLLADLQRPLPTLPAEKQFTEDELVDILVSVRNNKNLNEDSRRILISKVAKALSG